MHLVRAPAVTDQPPVDHLLEHPGPAAGGVLLVAGRHVGGAHHAPGAGVVGQAAAHARAAVHRVHQRAAVVQQPQARPRLGQRARQPQVRVDRTRVDEHPRVEHAGRVQGPLHLPEQVERVLRVHRAEQLRAGAAVAVLARQGAVVRRHQRRRLLEEGPEPTPAAGAVEAEVDPDVHAAVAEVAVGHPVVPVGAEQVVERTQVAAEPGRRDRGVLPPGVRGPVEAARGQAGAVLADPPQREHLLDVGDHPVPGGRGVPGHRLRPRGGLLGGLPGDLGEQPPGAARELGHDRGATPGADHRDDPLVEPLAGHERVVQQPGYGVGGLGHRRVAEHRQRTVGGVADQPHGRAEHHREGALAADEEPVEPPAVLGEQVLEAVAGDLAAEPAELGADRGQPAGDHLVERGRRGRCGGGAGPEGQTLAGAGDHVEPHHVVDGAAVAQGPGAAGVVADHPADRAPGVRRRVGPEPQTVPADLLLQGGVHRPRLDDRGRGLGVDGDHPVEVAGGVHDDAGADRVARDRRTGSAQGERGAGRPRRGHRREQLLHVAGTDHDLRHDPVQRRVRGVHRPGQRRVVDVADPRRAEGGRDVARPRCAHHRDREARRISAASSAVTSRGAVASSRCCLSAPSTRSSTSPSS